MKKLIAVLLLLMMVASIMAVSAFADDATVSISAEPAKAKAGETFVVTVSVSANPGFVSGSCTLTAANATLESVSGVLFNGPTVNTANGKVAFSSSEPVGAEGGVLFTATYKVNEDATESASVSAVVTLSNTVEGKRVKFVNAQEVSAAVEVETEAPAHVHAWDEGTVTTNPTCTEKGVKTFHCSGCDETKTEEIAALGHKWGEWTVTKEPTTTEKGERQRVCENDPSHIEKEEIPVVTCDHEWGEGVVTTEPTCTEAGVKTFTCSKCGETKTETIPAKGHAWGEWTVTTEASCTEAGEQQRVCANDAAHVEKQTIPAKGHAWGEWTVTKKASCTEDGEQERVCANDETHVEKQTIKALGHDWEEKVIKPATTTEEGEKELTCKRCGEKKTEVIPKIENKPAATTKPAGKNDNPKTGDEMNVALYAGILVLCGAATVAVVSKKKNHG